jgi:hypothetical protein
VLRRLFCSYGWAIEYSTQDQLEVREVCVRDFHTAYRRIAHWRLQEACPIVLRVPREVRVTFEDHDVSVKHSATTL